MSAVRIHSVHFLANSLAKETSRLHRILSSIQSLILLEATMERKNSLLIRRRNFQQNRLREDEHLPPPVGVERTEVETYRHPSFNPGRSAGDEAARWCAVSSTASARPLGRVTAGCWFKSAECSCSPRVCVSSHRVLQLPPTVQRHAG